MLTYHIIVTPAKNHPAKKGDTGNNILNFFLVLFFWLMAQKMMKSVENNL